MDRMLVLPPVLVPRLLLFAFSSRAYEFLRPVTSSLLTILHEQSQSLNPKKRPSFGRSNSRDIGRGRALTERTTFARSNVPSATNWRTEMDSNYQFHVNQATPSRRSSSFRSIILNILAAAVFCTSETATSMLIAVQETAQ